MIPLSDDTKRIHPPVVTLSLIAVNTIIFLYQVSLGPRAGQALVFTYGMIPAHVEQALNMGVGFGPALEPLFTSMFLHSGWLHLIGNMWFLWIFGDNVEDAFGHFGYLVFYLASGILAGVTHTIVNWGSKLPAIGASGAIAAVMGAYFVLYPRSRILTLVFVFFIRLPAILVIGIWFLIQFFSGVGSLGVPEAGGVAFWAHIGGFVVGVLVGLAVRPGANRPLAYY